MFHQPPSGPVRAKLDGEVTSYFEWLGAGSYRVDQRSGAMHGQRYFVEELRYGSDGASLYLRLDFVDTLASIQGTELHISAGSPTGLEKLHIVPLNGTTGMIEAIHGKICEVKVPLSAIEVAAGHAVRFQISLWQGGLPMDVLPPQGWIEFSTAEPSVARTDVVGQAKFVCSLFGIAL